MNACRIDGCAGLYEARGLCRRHYQRWRRGTLALGDLPPFTTNKPYGLVTWIPPNRPRCTSCGAHHRTYEWDAARWFCAACKWVFDKDGAA